MTGDLVTFLRARLDEDEQIANAAPRYDWTIYLAGDPQSGEETEQRVLDHVIRHDPGRVLREVEAKRRIVAHLASVSLSPWPISLPDGYLEDAARLLKLLALPYADHPDYLPEWRP